MANKRNAARRGEPGGAFENVQRGSGHSKDTKSGVEPQAGRLTASRAAVFETWWACPYCAHNAYFEVDLHPFTFAALDDARKTPAVGCAVPRCRQFIPRDLNHEPIQALVNDPVWGCA